MPEFYMLLARKMPELYMPEKYLYLFWGRGVSALPLLPSPTPMLKTKNSNIIDVKSPRVHP